MDTNHKDFHDNDIALVAVDYSSDCSILYIQVRREHKKSQKLELNLTSFRTESSIQFFHSLYCRKKVVFKIFCG